MRELRSVKRVEALAEVERQIANGSLHIRQMSPDDRARYPARPERGRRGTQDPARTLKLRPRARRR